MQYLTIWNMYHKKELKSMNYNEYKNEVLIRLKDYYGEDADIEVSEVQKNNGKKKDGLHIRFSAEERITPVIYLDEMYSEYMEGKLDIEDSVGTIVDTRKKYEFDESIYSSKQLMQNILDWENVKKKVYPILLSAEMNKVMKKTYVSKDYLDLSIFYIIKVDNLCNGEGMASIKITYDLLKRYGVALEILHEQAIRNMETEGYQVENLFGMLTGLEIDIEDPQTDMYVLSNRAKMYGATGIVNQRMLSELLGEKKYIMLPSSVHEWILLPYSSENADIPALKAMVKEVNKTVLRPEDKLSDEVYLYEKDNGISLLCS